MALQASGMRMRRREFGGGQLERHNFSSQSMRLSDKEIVRNPKKFFPGGS